MDQTLFRVVGLKHTNLDGTSRVDVARNLRIGVPLVLAREPFHPCDPHAVAVLTRDGQQIGYLSCFDNEPVASMLDDGIGVDAYVANEVGRNQHGLPVLDIIVESDLEALPIAV